MLFSNTSLILTTSITTEKQWDAYKRTLLTISEQLTRPHFYQTRSAWSMDQGSNENHSPVNNFAPTVTKFCVMWEGQALPHDTNFGNCRDKIVDSRLFLSWSLIHGSSWSGLIKVGPDSGLVASSLYYHQATTKECQDIIVHQLRWSYDCLIMGIPLLVRQHVCTNQALLILRAKCWFNPQSLELIRFLYFMLSKKLFSGKKTPNLWLL